MEEYCDFQNT